MRLDAAARRKAKAPSINHVEPKLSHALGAIPKRCTEPYPGVANPPEGVPVWVRARREARSVCGYRLRAFLQHVLRPGSYLLTGAGWVEAALRHKRLLLNVPPRHAKTTLMSKWFVIWQLACDRDTQVIIISKTTALGELISRYIADQLEANEALIKDFGRFRPRDLTRPWREGELEIEGQGPDQAPRTLHPDSGLRAGHPGHGGRLGHRGRHDRPQGRQERRPTARPSGTSSSETC